MSTITLDTFKDLMERLPPIPRLPKAVILSQRLFNQQISMQIEMMGIRVYRNPFPFTPIPRIVCRSNYKTRARFKHARLYWRRFDRQECRMLENTAYLLFNTAQDRELRFAHRFIG